MKNLVNTCFLLSTAIVCSGFLSPRSNIRVKTLPKPPSPLSTPATTLKMIGCSPTVGTTKKLAVAGRIPWRKLIMSKAQAMKFVSTIRAETDVIDIGIMLSMLAFSQSIGKFVYNTFFHRFRKRVSYEKSITKEIVENIRQASGLGLFCYFFDIIEIFLEVAGIDNTKFDFSAILSKLLFATWTALRLRTYKRSFFKATFDQTMKWSHVKTGTEGKVEILDKITDFFLFGVLALIWIDILRIKRGNGLSSIFALGGAGTFVVTLACQDLAKKVLNGLAISTSEVFSVGDQIQLGDGTTGNVRKIGWLSTEVRGSDEIVTKIPNTQLSNVRVSNLSRMKQSQVKQSLRFKYEDLDKIPDLCKEIREEIVKSCPKVITNGSKPFRVKWTNFGSDHLEVLVDCRLQCPPIGDVYYDAREGIMEAIARAVKRKGAQFVPPTSLRVEMTNNSTPQDTVLIQDVL